jgi:hypothetical protein
VLSSTLPSADSGCESWGSEVAIHARDSQTEGLALLALQDLLPVGLVVHLKGLDQETDSSRELHVESDESIGALESGFQYPVSKGTTGMQNRVDHPPGVQESCQCTGIQQWSDSFSKPIGGRLRCRDRRREMEMILWLLAAFHNRVVLHL